MAEEQKTDWRNADYIWANFSLYGKVKGLKIYEPREDMKRRSVREKTLFEALGASEIAEAQALAATGLRYENGEKIALEVLEDGDTAYLSAQGVLRDLKETYGSEKEKSAAYIARIATDRKLCLIGDALCMRLTEKEPSAKDYEDMIVLLWKIQKFGGCGYV